MRVIGKTGLAFQSQKEYLFLPERNGSYFCRLYFHCYFDYYEG